MGVAPPDSVSFGQVMFKFAFVALIFCGFASGVCLAQASRLEPPQPRWGQTLTAVYDPQAPGAKFTAQDDVFVIARLSFPDRDETVSAQMTKVGAQFKYELPVRESLSSVALHFITLGGGWDEQAYTTTMIFRADGKPVRGAQLSRMQAQRYRDVFAREIALYPDNFSAYRAKWMMAMLVEGPKAVSGINADLKKLSRLLIANAELPSVLACGYALVGNEAQSRELLRRLAKNFSDSPFTGRAFADYLAQTATPPTKDAAAKEVAQLRLLVVEQYPASAFARQTVTELAEGDGAPLALIEAVTQAWRNAEPENPLPYFVFARACQKQYRQYDAAAVQIEQAIKLLAAGQLRLYGDISGTQTANKLPESYLLSAELAFRRNQTTKALTAVKMAQSVAGQSGFAAPLLEAKIWQAAGEAERAETAFLEAWRRGSTEAEERLKARYREERGNLQGFDDYLLAKGKSVTRPEANWKQAAPNFRVTSLDGKTFDLKNLAGQIVVLNFWFIACGPCRREIPQLNRLVSEFKDRNVVFLGLALDDVAELRSFLQTTPFAYHVVPRAEELILSKFNTAEFPTHLVIDANSLVELTLVGGSERRPEEVRRAILRLLNSPK